MLTVILGSRVEDLDIASLAARKVTEDQSANLAEWLALWVSVEPDQAVAQLAKTLSGMESGEDKTTFAMKFVTELWGGRRSDALTVRKRFITPQHLKSLYLLMRQYIREEDDIDRLGTGTYSPGLRDDAQDARDRIIQELNRLPGKETFVALSEIASVRRTDKSHHSIELLCLRRAEQDADLEPWSETNVREFNDRLDRRPSTHRELADLAALRLLDLKDSLENGDDSVADIIQTVDEETKLRNFLGRELRQMAFGRYSIPQEEELADAKRPDLRFHCAWIDAPVPAELKIADKWSGPALLERLENQLAGDYLRDNRSGRGLFVLVYRGKKVSWEILDPSSGSVHAVNFDGLIGALREHWTRIAWKHPNVDNIEIIGIDLTRRRN
ncbi:hypothetical protein RPPS3_45080 [Rhodopseudomonas palustris]|uniref:hypothetical protein n=1 Tax=Rhodopseudomonas palustris TaxID=1076 RepID=UPI000D1AB196|nr:hypothetical protein [Rhodopseudomonas palustris]AVT78570.1 hypothetical protein RPPS3_45080 [Rhodopseudomonas palustris]